MAEFEPRRAFEHIDKLAYEIGPRLAGTAGAKHAADYIQKQLEGYGYKPVAQEFGFVPRTVKTQIRAILLIFAFVVSLFLPAIVSLAVFLLAILIGYVAPYVVPKRLGKNITATTTPKEPKTHLLVGAHYDSARCTVRPGLNKLVKLAFLPVILAFTVLLLLRLAGIPPLAWLIAWICLAPFFLAVCSGMLISASGKRGSPGANDNASGVALMLEAARVVADAPPSDVALTFVAFDAEEQGLVGSIEFVKKQRFGPGKFVMFNLDTIGAGKQAYVIEGNGLLQRHRTAPKINEALMQCCERAGLKPKLWWAALARHDHIPFLRAKLQATTLTMDAPSKDDFSVAWAKKIGLPNARARGYRQMHTMDDIPDKIELANIERAGQVVLEFIKEIGK